MSRRVVTVVVALGLMAGCTRVVGPTRTADAYALKASATADAVLSAVRTAQITAEAASRGRAFASYTAVALDDAENDASGASATFASLQPPDAASDAVRDDLIAITDDATAVLATLRISARRGDLDVLARQARPLEDIARRLEDFSEEVG